VELLLSLVLDLIVPQPMLPAQLSILLLLPLLVSHAPLTVPLVTMPLVLLVILTSKFPLLTMLSSVLLVEITLPIVMIKVVPFLPVTLIMVVS